MIHKRDITFNTTRFCPRNTARLYLDVCPTRSVSGAILFLVCSRDEDHLVRESQCIWHTASAHFLRASSHPGPGSSCGTTCSRLWCAIPSTDRRRRSRGRLPRRPRLRHSCRLGCRLQRSPGFLTHCCLSDKDHSRHGRSTSVLERSACSGKPWHQDTFREFQRWGGETLCSGRCCHEGLGIRWTAGGVYTRWFLCCALRSPRVLSRRGQRRSWFVPYSWMPAASRWETLL